MGDEKDAFYVVWKGGIIGVYKSINDLESVLRSSVMFFSLIYLCFFAFQNFLCIWFLFMLGMFDMVCNSIL